MRTALLLSALILMPLAARPAAVKIDATALDRDRILAAADAALTSAPISITQHRAPLSEGGPNDFFSMSDYYWPDPTKPDGKPYVQRDGQSYTGLFNEHRKAVMHLRDTVAALAAAYRVTGEERYAEKAAALLRVFFVDPATRMSPNLEHAQVMVGKPAPTRGIGIIDTLHLIEVPMAIRALEGSKSLTPDLRDALRSWFRDYLTWLRDSPRGKDEGRRTNNHAVAFWLQIAAFCQIAPDETLRTECRRQFKEVFVAVQMAADGSFPQELKRTKPYAYSIFQLDNMATLCQLLSTPEDNLWTFQTADGRGMRKAMAHLFPYLADKSKWPLPPDVQAWEEWPVRQSSLLFAGQALGEDKYVALWRRLKPDPTLFEIRRNNAITQPVLWLDPAVSPGAMAVEPVRPFRAKDVFDGAQAIVFQDDFRSGQFGRWNFSEDDRYRLQKESPDRMAIVDAPGLIGKKAVRFTVPRAPNSFRAEISLPHENGFQERWYGARILVPSDWVCDPSRGNDLVIQWHAIPGNGRATFPNLEISVGNTNWFIRQSYGSAQTKPTRTNQRLDDPVRPGTWAAWVVHAKWSPRDDGVLQIWKDGRLVLDRTGTNVYSTIGVEYTPYLKTGIYHPEWHLDKDGKREAFERERPVATNKVIFVTDVKVGDARARYEDVAPE